MPEYLTVHELGVIRRENRLSLRMRRVAGVDTLR